MRPTRRDLLRLIPAAALAAAAPRALAADRPQVAATTGMIADAARVIGGDRVEVRGLIGSGLDPHAWRPTRTDVAALDRADLVLWNGLNLEAQIDALLARLAARKPVVAVAETLDPARLLPDDEVDGAFDPHVWMDPVLWTDALGAVRDALAAADPEGAGAFAEAHAAEAARLAALHAYAAEVLAGVPAEARVLITAHDAFGYFARAYGFEVEGVQGLSTESEAGLARIGELVELIVSRRIGAVFAESSVSDRNVRALVEGAAARGHRVQVGAELFSDAMGPEGTYEGTYVGMIDHNVTAVARALGGAAPARGMSGRLSAGL